MVLFVCFLFYFKIVFLFYILSTDPLNGWATHSTRHFQGSFWVEVSPISESDLDL